MSCEVIKVPWPLDRTSYQDWKALSPQGLSLLGQSVCCFAVCGDESSGKAKHSGYQGSQCLHPPAPALAHLEIFPSNVEELRALSPQEPGYLIAT